MRTAITKSGGKVADPGSVLFNFQRQGLVMVDAKEDEDKVICQPQVADRLFPKLLLCTDITWYCLRLLVARLLVLRHSPLVLSCRCFQLASNA